MVNPLAALLCFGETAGTDITAHHLLPMHPLHRLGRLIADLPTLGPDGPGRDFGSAAVARLAAALGADSGVWASGALTAQGPDFHTVSLWRQPPELLRDYEALKHHDPLFAQSAAHPGRAFSGSAAATLPPAFAPFVARYGLAQALSALVVDAHSGLLNGFSLWRSAPERPFTPDDEVLLEAALPHLVAQGRARLLRAESGPVVPLARACADPRGRLHAVTEPFMSLLVRHWPAWRGPDLPPELGAALPRVHRPQQSVHGPLVLRCTPAVPWVLLDLRLHQPWDGLSRREQTVAGMAAEGASHKEIAQALGLAPATVRNHLAHSYQALGVHNRAQLQACRAAARFAAGSAD